MAASIRYVARINLGVISSNITRQLQINSARTFITDSGSGIEDYRHARNSFAEKYKMAGEAFRKKLRSSLSEDTGLVFTEDLKAMLHLIEKSPEDLELTTRMLKKYCSRNSEIRFGTFKLGPIVMRAFHFLNEPEIALEAFNDPTYGNFFDQMTTYMVLLDLLLENGMYQQVIDTYEIIRTNRMVESSHPKLTIPILAMACYKRNTPESLAYGLKAIEELTQKGSVPLRKVISIFAALALKQDKPHIALELISLCKTADYISIRCIRMMAFADLDRLDDVALEFRNAIQRGYPERNNYYSDVATKVEKAIERMNIPENAEINELLSILKTEGYILPTTLEQGISEPIDLKKRVDLRTTRNYEDQGWSNSGSQRNGLRDGEDRRSGGNWGGPQRRFNSM